MPFGLSRPAYGRAARLTIGELDKRPPPRTEGEHRGRSSIRAVALLEGKCRFPDISY